MNRTRKRPWIAIVIACSIWLTGCTTLKIPTHALVFSAVGDGPRSEQDWAKLRQQVAVESSDGQSRFFLHLGDIWHGTDTLPASHYAKVATILQQSRIPVFIVPGDNEWNDLKDPDQGWKNWTKYFMRFDAHWPNEPDVQRQQVRPENLAFTVDGVLFVGINLVGGRVLDPAEWKARHRQDMDWVRKNLREKRAGIRAAVVFAQAKPRPANEDFFAPFVETVKAFKKPVLYLHGDGHVWQDEAHWRAHNLTRVQVSALGKAPPVRVLVTHSHSRPFRFDRQFDNPAYKEDYEPIWKDIRKAHGFGFR